MMCWPVFSFKFNSHAAWQTECNMWARCAQRHLHTRRFSPPDQHIIPGHKMRRDLELHDIRSIFLCVRRQDSCWHFRIMPEKYSEQLKHYKLYWIEAWLSGTTKKNYHSFYARHLHISSNTANDLCIEVSDEEWRLASTRFDCLCIFRIFSICWRGMHIIKTTKSVLPYQ